MINFLKKLWELFNKKELNQYIIDLYIKSETNLNNILIFIENNVFEIDENIVNRIKKQMKNKDFLEALDKLISSSAAESEIVELSIEQKMMLEMSEKDIKNGKLISQDAMDKRNLEWLNEL